MAPGIQKFDEQNGVPAIKVTVEYWAELYKVKRCVCGANIRCHLYSKRTVVYGHSEQQSPRPLGGGDWEEGLSNYQP
ncbi:hypothetical protein AGMMS50256_19990 [Betaproteobacteria bacterium]|nr:hypothetical protein AGMMS50256_19990 [Betaproteobacteria bacterium]